MIEVLGVTIAFLALLWAVTSYFISSRKKKLNGPALLEIAPESASTMKKITLQDSHQTCCYCREEAHQVNVYRLTFKGTKKSTGELIVLCSDCAREIQNERLLTSK